MTTLTQYNQSNITNSKQFNSALKTVFGSIAERNNQIQQLLIVAVNEAARESGGQVTNNLDWLSNALLMAQEAKGINVVKLSQYVKDVLCCGTICWNSKESKIKKTAAKNVKLTYNLEPKTTWFNYGKKETVAKAFDYSKRLTSAVDSAMSMEKGGLTINEVMLAILASKNVTLSELLQAIDTVNPLKEAA